MSALHLVPLPNFEFVRKCHVCNCPDHLIHVAGAQNDKDLEHFVKPEWIPMERGEQDVEYKRYILKGWERKVLDGRLGVANWTCINCLNENDLRDRIWGELKSAARRLEQEQNKGDEWYLGLVEDWQ